MAFHESDPFIGEQATHFETTQLELVEGPVVQENESAIAEVIDLEAVREEVSSLFTSETIDSKQTVPAITPPTIASEFPEQKSPEKKEAQKAKLTVRAAQRSDIPKLVEIDMESFDSVYRDYGQSPEELRAELTTKFEGRYDMVGGDWIQVLEKNGEPVGFMMCCPTNKSPNDFKSWEDTTDNGTLATTYDPNGENIYVVSLSVTRAGSGDLKGQNMIIANQMGKMLAEGYKLAFFESRMPGFRDWAITKLQGRDVDNLGAEEKDILANEYFNMKTVIKGKERPYDRLLRMYEGVGCKLLRLVPDAYKDAPSMDYGVVCTLENMLPSAIQRNKLASKLAGNALRRISKSQRIVQKLF